MANAIGSVATFEGVAQDLFLKPFLGYPTVTDLGLNIKVSNTPSIFHFNSQLNKATVAKVACGHTYATGAAITKKVVTPVEFECAIEQCETAFLSTYFAEGMPAGIARGELSPEIVDVLTQLHNDVFSRDMITKLFLSDTTSGQSFYNSFNGIYKKLETATYDAGALTSTNFTLTNIEATMFNIYNTQSNLLKSLPDSQKVFFVTGNVYDAWKRWCQANVAAFNNSLVINGVETVTYNGIKLVPCRWVDTALATDFLVSGNPVNPYRIILTVGSNHIVQLDKAAFGDAKAWYSPDDDVYRIAGSVLFAYETGYDELNVVAGF